MALAAAAGAQTRPPDSTEGNNPVVKVRRAECGKEPGQLASVVGRAAIAGPSPAGGVELLLFNGFEALTTLADDNGSYCLPLTRSTPGTFVSVFASRAGFLPQVRNLRVEGGHEGHFPQRSVLQVPDITLAASPRPGAGSVIGVLYVLSVSGRPEPHEGILAFDSGVPLSIEGPEPAQLNSGEAGVFSALLSPGRYRITTGRNIVIPDVQLLPGGTTVQLVFSGERINF